MTKRTGARIGVVMTLGLLGACAPMAGGMGTGPGRSVSLIASDGRSIGSVALAANGSMTARVAAKTIPFGVHGMHLHEIGLCTGPGFASAGAHLNPGGKQHGADNPLGPHLGDLPSIDVGAEGGMARIAPVGASLADADGTALVIHAQPDDYKTDPSGNSGDRIACAVIAPAR